MFDPISINTFASSFGECHKELTEMNLGHTNSKEIKRKLIADIVQEIAQLSVYKYIDVPREVNNLLSHFYSSINNNEMHNNNVLHVITQYKEGSIPQKHEQKVYLAKLLVFASNMELVYIKHALHILEPYVIHNSSIKNGFWGDYMNNIIKSIGQASCLDFWMRCNNMPIHIKLDKPFIVEYLEYCANTYNETNCNYIGLADTIQKAIEDKHKPSRSNLDYYIQQDK